MVRTCAALNGAISGHFCIKTVKYCMDTIALSSVWLTRQMAIQSLLEDSKQRYIYGIYPGIYPALLWKYQYRPHVWPRMVTLSPFPRMAGCWPCPGGKIRYNYGIPKPISLFGYCLCHIFTRGQIYIALRFHRMTA